MSKDGGRCVSKDGGKCVSKDGGRCVSKDGVSCVNKDGGKCVSKDGVSCVNNGGRMCVKEESVLTSLRAASVHIISPAFNLPVSVKHTLKQNCRSLQLSSSSRRMISDTYTCLWGFVACI